MKQIEFIERLAEKGYTKRDAKQIVDDMMNTIIECMINGESVKLHGFGTFSVADIPDRESVDVQTKERFVIPGHKAPKFIAGKLLRRAVKEGVLRV